MSQNNLPEVQVTDLTKDEQTKLTQFIERGAPGFNLGDENTITRMLDLYLGGKTYSQISRINRVPKELVMLYAQKLNWYVLKIEYMQELEMHLKGRVINAKVASQDFLIQLLQMYHKKIGTKMDRYLKTNDEMEADKINPKEIDKYLKIAETLHKISSDPTQKPAPAPAVGINVGDGVTVTKSEDGSVEITPKQKTIGSMLEQLANQRREAEAAKAKSSDIKDVTPENKQGETGNESK